MRIEEYLKDTNLNYPYKDTEITEIISCQVNFLLKNNNQDFRKKITFDSEHHKPVYSNVLNRHFSMGLTKIGA